MARIVAAVTSWSVEDMARPRRTLTGWFWIVTPRSQPPNGMTQRAAPPSQPSQRTGIGWSRLQPLDALRDQRVLVRAVGGVEVLERILRQRHQGVHDEGRGDEDEDRDPDAPQDEAKHWVCPFMDKRYQPHNRFPRACGRAADGLIRTGKWVNTRLGRRVRVPDAPSVCVRQTSS